MEPSREHEAMHYTQLEQGAVQCGLCGHHCVIKPGQLGFCAVRRNDDGVLVTLNFGRLVAANLDPIEKKPMYHVLPGTRTWSIAAVGCNFQCEYCQNWEISQAPRELRSLRVIHSEPAQIVAEAKHYGAPSISYTYTEPTVYFELAYETAVLAQKEGLANIFVSNGYMTQPVIERLAPVIDAINIDLKAFSDQTYRRIMKARLKPVLECLKMLVAAKVWVEVTTLIVPGMNDSEGELAEIAKFIAGELGHDVPWHITPFHDDYQVEGLGRTPRQSLLLATQIGREAGLRYIYGGDLYDTQCPSCSELLVAREGFSVTMNNLISDACPRCGEHIAGRWRKNR